MTDAQSEMEKIRHRETIFFLSLFILFAAIMFALFGLAGYGFLHLIGIAK